jgi:hypothetical protein
LKFLPSSHAGKWAAALGISALVVFLFLYLFTGNLVRLPDVVIVILGALCLIASLAALIVGIAAVVKFRERGLLVFLALLIGLVSLLRLFSIFFRNLIR